MLKTAIFSAFGRYIFGIFRDKAKYDNNECEATHASRATPKRIDDALLLSGSWAFLL